MSDYLQNQIITDILTKSSQALAFQARVPITAYGRSGNSRFDDLDFETPTDNYFVEEAPRAMEAFISFN